MNNKERYIEHWGHKNQEIILLTDEFTEYGFMENKKYKVYSDGNRIFIKSISWTLDIRCIVLQKKCKFIKKLKQ